MPPDLTNAVASVTDAVNKGESLSVLDASKNNGSQLLKLPMNTDIQCEHNMDDIIATIYGLGTNFTLIRNELNTLNNDAEISDENIVRVARRITNVEHFLRSYGLSTIMD